MFEWDLVLIQQKFLKFEVIEAVTTTSEFVSENDIFTSYFRQVCAFHYYRL